MLEVWTTRATPSRRAAASSAPTAVAFTASVSPGSRDQARAYAAR